MACLPATRQTIDRVGRPCEELTSWIFRARRWHPCRPLPGDFGTSRWQLSRKAKRFLVRPKGLRGLRCPLLAHCRPGHVSRHVRGRRTPTRPPSVGRTTETCSESFAQACLSPPVPGLSGEGSRGRDPKREAPPTARFLIPPAQPAALKCRRCRGIWLSPISIHPCSVRLPGGAGNARRR